MVSAGGAGFGSGGGDFGDVTLGVLGALDSAAAAGDPSDSKVAMAMLKQIINVLMGSNGISVFPTAATPNQGVSLAEVIRQIYEDLVVVNDFLDTEVAAILADTGTDGVVVNSRTTAANRIAGEIQILEVSITAALNAGLTTVATITDQPCLIKSVVIHADTAAHADMTTCAVKGGNSQIVTFISTADATEDNLNAIDKQVSWFGAVRLAATKTIMIDLLGVGATAADLTITIEYEACVDGGSLA